MHILPLKFAANYKIKKFILFIAMLHQRRCNCLYEHSSSVPVQNKTNQFSQNIKLISLHCREGDWWLQSPSNRTSWGPSLLGCSSWIPKCMHAWDGCQWESPAVLPGSRGFSFLSESGFSRSSYFAENHQESAGRLITGEQLQGSSSWGTFLTPFNLCLKPLLPLCYPSHHFHFHVQ